MNGLMLKQRRNAVLKSGTDNQHRISGLSTSHLKFNMWNVVGNTFSSNMI